MSIFFTVGLYMVSFLLALYGINTSLRGEENGEHCPIG
jgi:hypothetical protein